MVLEGVEVDGKGAGFAGRGILRLSDAKEGGKELLRRTSINISALSSK